MQFLGESNGHPLWSPEESDTVEQMYPGGYAPIVKKLKRRSYYAIRHRAEKLGIQKKRHVWTGADVSRLRKIYPLASPAELKRAFPGMPLDSIRANASRFGIFRKRRKLVETGVPVIDQIRDRAHELNLSMVEVDAMARTGKYFAHGNFSTHSKRGDGIKYIARAVQALGGHLTATWDEL